MSVSVTGPDILQACAPGWNPALQILELWSHGHVRPPHSSTQRRQDSGMSLWCSGAALTDILTHFLLADVRLSATRDPSFHHLGFGWAVVNRCTRLPLAYVEYTSSSKLKLIFTLLQRTPRGIFLDRRNSHFHKMLLSLTYSVNVATHNLWHL